MPPQGRTPSSLEMNGCDGGVDMSVDNRNGPICRSQVVEEDFSLVGSECHGESIVLECHRCKGIIHTPSLDNSFLIHIIECVTFVQPNCADKKLVEGAECHAVDGDIVLLFKAMVDCGRACRSCIPESQNAVISNASQHGLAEYRIFQL